MATGRSSTYPGAKSVQTKPATSLNRADVRAEAADTMRALIEEIRLVPEEGRLEIELAGDLAGILALANGSKKPASVGGGLQQVTLVAGARNHRQYLICAAV